MTIPAAPLCYSFQTTIESWLAVFAFTFQIYFDFSGYSDMAVGIARMFNIILPINFDSPYKASSIIEFWQRWHITLSRFIREYIYFPLGGNRKGRPRQYVNSMATMLLCGLWHGASWNFVLWGGLHWVYLIINHIWRSLTGRFLPDIRGWSTGKHLGRCITFLAVTVSWVLFRAENCQTALSIMKGLAGLNGISFFIRLKPLIAGLLGSSFAEKLTYHGFFPHQYMLSDDILGYQFGVMFFFLYLLAVCWFLPNVYEFMARYRPVSDSKWFVKTCSNMDGFNGGRQLFIAS